MIKGKVGLVPYHLQVRCRKDVIEYENFINEKGQINRKYAVCLAIF